MNVDFDRLSRAAFVLLRMVTGFLFFQIGANKILGWHGGMPPDGSTAVFPSQIWIGGMLELVGGIAVLVGLFTRPVAFVLSGEMAVAYWQFHFARDKVWPVENGGTPAVLFCFVFLYFAAAGAGPWSLDALLRRRRLAGGPAATPRTSLADRTYEGSTVHARPRNAGGGGAPGSPGSPYARPAAAEGPGDAPSGPSPVGPADRWVESVLWRGRGRADFVALLDPADRKWCREYTGTWREKYERNFPGPFYSTTMNLNSLAACAAAADDRLVGRGRPRLVICAHDSTEWIWRQPADVDEMRRLLVAMANDEVDSYPCDGNRHWAAPSGTGGQSATASSSGPGALSRRPGTTRPTASSARPKPRTTTRCAR